MPSLDIAVVGKGPAAAALAKTTGEFGLTVGIFDDTAVWHIADGALHAPQATAFRRLVVVETLVSAALHETPIPDNNLTWALGCAHHWDPADRCWRVRLDSAGRTSRPNVWVTAADAPAGSIAAFAIAADLGVLAKAVAARHIASLARKLPPKPPAPVADATIVCRCEGVTRREIADAIAQGCEGPNQLKAFTGCGMGECQGRECGAAVTELLIATTGRAPDQIGYFRIRMPLRPVPLGQIADSDA